MRYESPFANWDKADDEWKNKYGFTLTYFLWWCHVILAAIPLLIMGVLTTKGVDGFRPYGQNTGDKERNTSRVINNNYSPRTNQTQIIYKDK